MADNNNDYTVVKANRVTAFVGRTFGRNKGTKFNVDRIELRRYRKLFDPKRDDDDVALLHLTKASTNRPLWLLPTPTLATTGLPLVLHGYGQTDFGEDTSTGHVLRKTRDGSNMLDPTCEAATDGIVCADSVSEADSTPGPGDSGGAWVTRVDGTPIQVLVESGITTLSDGRRWDYGESVYNDLTGEWIRSHLAIPKAFPGRIVRDPDTEEAWLIDGDGFRRPIPDGGVYRCLEESGSDVVNLPRAAIDLMAARTVVAACGTGPGDATTLTAGFRHSCALKNGEVYCWGDNSYGQLGNGTTTMSTPVKVRDSSGTGVLSGVTDVAATLASHTCAVSEGEVYCWGSNFSGELGDGSTTNRSLPTKVPGLVGVTDVEVGDRHSCALAGGDVYCWGDNSSGQLGDGKTGTSHYLPARVVDVFGTEVSWIQGKPFQTCALAGGDPYCWGDDWAQQHSSAVPVKLQGVSGTTEISGDAYQTCALTRGEVYCWDAPDTPMRVDGLSGVTTTAVGTFWMFAADSVAVYGFSRNSGSTFKERDLAGVTELAVGWEHKCARLSDEVRCWGSNSDLQLGGGSENGDGTVTVTLGA